MLGLALRIDALAQDMKWRMVDLATDELDLPIALGLTESIDFGRSISFSQTRVKAFDMRRKEKLAGSITIQVKNAPFELDIKRVGQLTVVGKDDPFIFATDIVANSLFNHLTNLPVDARLNAPSSISGWELATSVLGVDENSMDDIL